MDSQVSWTIKGPTNIFGAQTDITCTIVLPAGQLTKVWCRLILKIEKSDNSLYIQEKKSWKVHGLILPNDTKGR